jgi:transposase
MARAYSDDLRRKFAEAYERGGVSLAKLAARFGVSVGWAEKLRRTQRKTGQIERPQGGKRGPRSKLTEQLRQEIHSWIRARPDLTLVELQIQLWEQYQLEISLSRLWTVPGEMKLTLKKSHSTPPNRTPKQSVARASTGWRKRAGSIRHS